MIIGIGFDLIELIRIEKAYKKFGKIFYIKYIPTEKLQPFRSMLFLIYLPVSPPKKQLLKPLVQDFQKALHRTKSKPSISLPVNHNFVFYKKHTNIFWQAEQIASISALHTVKTPPERLSFWNKLRKLISIL